MDHSVVAPSLYEFIESAVWGNVGNDAEGSLSSFVGCENCIGLSCLGFRADGGFDRIAISNESLDSWDANKSIS
jgi:hypothetical protein